MPAAPALFARMRARLMGRLVRYLTGPVEHCTTATAVDQRSLAAILDRGDVLLIAGNTRVAAVIKRITRSPWSHVSMYVGPLEDGPDPPCIVEADIAQGVRSIRLSELNALNVRVLRPRSLNATDRCRLAAWVTGRIGSGYDVAHFLRLSLPMRLRSSPTIANSMTRFICCSLLAHAFALVGYPILSVQMRVSPAAADHRNLTPGDFEHASIFEEVGV